MFVFAKDRLSLLHFMQLIHTFKIKLASNYNSNPKMMLKNVRWSTFEYTVVVWFILSIERTHCKH